MQRNTKTNGTANASISTEKIESITEEIYKAYKEKLLPLEKAYKYEKYHQPPLETADFNSRPMIMLVGQYSTGKTTFIRYLLGSDFPGIRIGPEPTTDNFVIIMHGKDSNSISGNTLLADKDKPFRPLARFGSIFLDKVQCSTMNNQLLELFSIIDTPGILSGEKEGNDRGYQMNEVIEWFAHRVDRIIMLFDAHKLDISDEFKAVIVGMSGFEDKIRIVLNKADMINSQQLMRVYGALMWSLGRVMRTPEVARVYIGSFWSEQLKHEENKRLFELEEQDLFNDLRQLTRSSTMRKMNDLIKRARSVKLHALVLAELQKRMPAIFGKDARRKHLIAKLSKVYEGISKAHGVKVADLPNQSRMQPVLLEENFDNLPANNKRLIAAVDDFVSLDMPRIMQLIPQEMESQPQRLVVNGALAQDDGSNPFAFTVNAGLQIGKYDGVWPVEKFRPEMDKIFYASLSVGERVMSGDVAREVLSQSGLPQRQLVRIWRLSDVDRDGWLDADEFALAMYLIDLCQNGNELPDELPNHLVPPSKCRM